MEKFEDIDSFMKDYVEHKERFDEVLDNLINAWDVYNSCKKEMDLKANILHGAIMHNLGEDVIKIEIPNEEEPDIEEEKPVGLIYCMVCNQDYKNHKTFSKHLTRKTHQNALNKKK